MKPKNGRYRPVSGPGNVLDVRLELLTKQRPGWAVGIVSGDLVKGGKIHSFLSAPLNARKGLTTAAEGRKTVVAADVRFGENNFRSGAKGSLRLEFKAPGRARLVLKCASLKINEDVAVKWKDRFFRDLVIEIDKITPSAFPKPFAYRGTSWSLKKVFERAGFHTVVRPSDRDVADIGVGWTDGELNEVMHRLRVPKRDPWYCYVLVSSYYSEKGKIEDDTTGIMFDTDPARGDPPREGCAVFSSALRAYVDDQFRGKPKVLRDREYLMTMVHEIGHALNLVHSFDKDRKDSLSVMNYPDQYAYGINKYYDRFSFDPAFDELELLHLRHHSRAVTEPGYASGVAWSFGNFRRIETDGATPPPPPDIADNSGAARKWQNAYSAKRKQNNELLLDRLELKLSLAGTEVLAGAPLQGQVELAVAPQRRSERKGKQSFALTTSLEYSTHLLSVEIKRMPDGKWQERRHPMLRCLRPRKTTVTPGKPLTADLPLVYSSDGEFFHNPGDYQLRLRLLIGYQGQPHVLYSEPHAITVKAAATASEKSLQRLYRKPEVRHFMLLRGGAAKPETVAAVLKISENAPRTVSGTLAKLALVEHANALTTVPTVNLAQFRGPEAVHVALKELRPAATTLKLYSASVERVAGAATRSMGKRAVSDALARVRVSRRRSG